MRGQIRKVRERDRGVALILVLLAILVLTTLAAAMVFSARSDTFASYNYRIGAQAEYVARAGVQKALNFFESSNYVPADPTHDPTVATDPIVSPNTNVAYVYSLPSGTLGANGTSPYSQTPINLYYTNFGPVTCLSGVSGCSGSQVVLGATRFGSHYPSTTYTNGVDVVANWINFLNSSTGLQNSISDGLGGTGTFSVVARLLNYHTVNNAIFGTKTTCPSNAADDPWTDPLGGSGICRQPFEVWQVTSTGTWNSNLGAGAQQPTVQVVATISPMYMPSTGDAFYGLCSVSLGGGVCTDGYNSSSGDYANGTINPTTGCVTPTSGTTNAQATDAGIGSNGGVTINGGSYSVGGSVTYANSVQPPSSTCNSGFQGSTNGVAGSVLPGPAIPTPPPIDMTPWGYPTTSPTISPPKGTGSQYPVANVLLKQIAPPIAAVEYPGVSISLASPGQYCASITGGPYTGYSESFILTNGSPPIITKYNCTGISGAGTSSSPYILGDLVAGTTGNNAGTVNIIAPSTPISNPVFVAVDSINIGTGGAINTSNSVPTINVLGAPNNANSPSPTKSTATAFVVDDYSSLSLGGQGDLNYNPSTPGVPSPGYLTMNIECIGATSPCVSLTGNSPISAVIIAPTADVYLKGGGTNATFFGSILANNIEDKGGYPVHYDSSLNTASGGLYSVQVVSVTRQMY